VSKLVSNDSKYPKFVRLRAFKVVVKQCGFAECD
jgi:hypothetical protein